MDVRICCPYCRHMYYARATESLFAPTRTWMRGKCPACGSRCAIDLTLRRTGKSETVRKRDEEREKQLRLVHWGEYQCGVPTRVRVSNDPANVTCPACIKALPCATSAP
jgi:hypothetical protein